MSEKLLTELEKYTKSNQKDLNKVLGNVCLAGMPNQGFVRTIQTFLTYSILKKQNIIIFTNKHSSLFSSIQQYRKQHQDQNFQIAHIDFSDIANSDKFNPFLSFEPSDNKDLILEMFSQYKKLNDTEFMKVERYLLSVMRILTDQKIPITFDNLIDYDIDALLKLVENSTFRDAEKRRMIRFLNEMFPHYVILESYFDLLNEHGIGDILSGDQRLESILSDKDVLLFTLDQNQKNRLSSVMLKLMSSLLQRLIRINSIDQNYWIFMDGIQFEEISDLNGLLQLSFAHAVNSVFTIEDISSMTRKHGNAFVDYASSFFVFTQKSNENCTYWSQFFGTYEHMEKNYTYTNAKPTFLNPGVVSRQPQTQTSMSTNRVQKPLYKPEVFQRLRENEAIIYLKTGNRRKKLTI